MRRLRVASMIALTCVAVSAARVDAQDVGFRGFGDVGSTRFAAAESFDAVVGTHTGVVFGGGAEVTFGGVFVGVRASRFQKDGTRVFVSGDEVFDLGIPTTIKVTPVQITGGYRFAGEDRRLVPYAGGGIGWHHYSERSDFADGDEDVSESNTGFHLLGGAEVRIGELFGVAGEVEWSRVPDALGQDPNSVSAAFDETDLGGVTFRVKFVVGR
jgi:opacity protein-like surface antigen